MVEKNQVENEKPKEPFRIDLDEEESRKFKELSEKLGIKIKTDIFRFCLSYTHEKYLKGK